MELTQIEKIIQNLATQPAGDLETQQLEFKSWCRNEKDLAKEISEATVCLANSEGGLVILGVDDKGGRAIRPCPYAAVTPDWVRKTIRDFTRPPVSAQVFRMGDQVPALSNSAAADVLVIEVRKTTNPSGHRTHRGVNLVRVDRECRVEYLVGSDDFTSVWLDHLSLSSLDEASIMAAVHLRRKVFPQLVDPELLATDHLRGVGLVQPRAGVAICGDGGLAPSLAALLLLGREHEIKAELKSAETVLTVDTMALSPLTSTNNLNLLLSLQRYAAEIARHLDARQSMIPAETIRELLLNAYIHRCYRTAAPIQIRIGIDEIEITNPGGLLGDLTPDSLLHAPAMYRNFTLADGARQFGICEKAGAGLNKVFMQLATAGYTFPYFEVGTNSFKVIVKTQRDLAFAKFIQDYAGTLNLGLTGLVILRVLRAKSESDMTYLARKAQRSVDYVENVVNQLERESIVVRHQRKGTLSLTESISERIGLYDDRGQLRLPLGQVK